jgi:hypothetical protein
MSDAETQSVSQDQPAAPTAQPAAPNGLTLIDLTVVLNILQVVSQRGAIRPEEMTTVGTVYERIFTFLESQGAVSRAQPAAQTDPAAPAAE